MLQGGYRGLSIGRVGFTISGMNRCRTYIFWALAASLLTGALAGAPGCTWFLPTPRELTGSGMDLFAPVAMRIHPLTQVLAGESGKIASTSAPAVTTARERPDQIEIHVEFKDQFGDVGKAVGIMNLRVKTPSFGLLDGHTVAEWSVDINSPRVNGQYWDTITRTYVFRYRATEAETMAAFQPGARFVIHATMEFANHSKLQDELAVAIKKAD